MKIGVTGATGRLGSLVVRELLASHPASDVIPVIRDLAKASFLQELGLESRVADYDYRESLEQAFSGLDKVLLISSNAMGRRVTQHTNVIDAVKSCGVEYLAYTSAPKAKTSPMFLAAEHKATEEYLESSGLEYTILRNNWYTENYGEAVRLAAKAGVLVAPALSDRVASATRADYAAGAAAVLVGAGHEGRVYEFTGDCAWGFSDLADTIGEVTGRECEWHPTESAEIEQVLVKSGMEAMAAKYYAIASGSMDQGALEGVSPDLSTLIGRPTTSLRETVKAVLDY